MVKPNTKLFVSIAIASSLTMTIHILLQSRFTTNIKKDSYSLIPVQPVNSFQHVVRKYNKNATTPQDLQLVLSEIANMSMSSLRNYWNCKEILRTTRPLYTKEEWKIMRNTYRRTVERIPIKNDKDRPNFKPPFYSAQTPDGKGRGIFASKDLKKGDVIYKGIHNYAFFKDGASYRLFLASLPEDGMRCDIMEWDFTQHMRKYGHDKLIIVSLDELSLTNNGGRRRSNKGCPRRKKCRFSEEYALRDIKKGEELLDNYGAFTEDLWGEFGFRKRRGVS